MKIGILGCGHIARKIANDLQYVDGVTLQAIGARSKESADAFALLYPVSNVHYSYEALVQDATVDLIYIATPHALHAAHALLCLQHGKHVLCEKSFTINTKQAEQVFEMAERNKLFVMEAFWTKFLPHYIRTKEMIDAGDLGIIQHINACFGFRVDKPIDQRLWNPALGGGSLLDIGVYNVFIAQSILGMPQEVNAAAQFSETNVDKTCTAQFRYDNGATVHLYSSFVNYAPIEVHIHGTQGRIHLTNRYYAPSSSVIFYQGTDETAIKIPVQQEEGWGYQYQVRHVKECWEQGFTQSPVISWQDTINQMKTLDAIRKSAGIVYAADSEQI